MQRFKRLDIGRCDQVIHSITGLRRDVDHKTRSDHLIHRHLIGGVGSFGKVDRRIHMRAAMLCCGEIVGRVEPAPSV